ncbi:TlpA family protein disulfide reductase [Labilibaculum filiforme]|uniref:TlpA family protein disulfide reductase n=1 Tax=Labilibaculum filiforme TaxID=1940526 RepID=UPI000C6E7EBD|nr:redoxin domain-containing protein [Labilibaculum filiforme]
MKIFLLLFLSFISINLSLADTVRIYGTNKTYAGSKIEIKYHTDVFTYSEKTLTDFTVPADGSFSINLDINEVTLVFLPLGVYKGYLYLEPGKEYEIKLPPKKDLSPVQKLNPFFELDELLIGVANVDTKDLNIAIRTLDDKIDPFINQNFHKIYRKKENSVGIAFSEEVRLEYNEISNPFFQDYLTYRLGFLDYLAYPNLFSKIEEKYFENKEIKLNNSAYTSLYKKQYGNFLTGYFSQVETSELSLALKSEDTYRQIYELMRNYPAYKNIQFRELIIATSVFDAFTRKFYSQNKTIEILTQLKEHSTNQYNQDLCENYIRKITHLQSNYLAPDFSIGKFKLANYKGKYLYLNFCNTESYPCLQDFKEIAKLKKQFGEHVEFLSIACDWEVSKYLEFTSKKSIDWPIVHIGDQQHLLGEYNIKAFPTYILINPEGKIVKAPAQGPKENIQLEFIKIARDAVRNSSRK